MLVSNEQRALDKSNVGQNRKCRIPQRLSNYKQRCIPKQTGPNEKNQFEIIPLYNNINLDKTNARSISGERAPITMPKRNFNEKLISSRLHKPIIIIPEKQKTSPKNATSKIDPDQDTTKNSEDIKLKTVFSDRVKMYDCDDTGEYIPTMVSTEADFTQEFQKLISSPSEKLLHLKTNWTEGKNQFEKMKLELNERQSTILRVFASLRDTQDQLSILGQKTSNVQIDDLRIMNVAQMSPQQLLQLCSYSKAVEEDSQDVGKNYLNIDLNKLNDIPSKLFDTCKQALIKQKEMIDWLDNLKNQVKEYSKRKLASKINEFNLENETLDHNLETVKMEFLKDLNNIIDTVRKCVKDTIAMSLRNEDLSYELTELNRENSDLKKQMYSNENTKPIHNKAKIEELEKALKEEKLKCKSIKERLSRSDAQVKNHEGQETRLKTALEHACDQVRRLERTVQNQHDRNEELQKEFDEELLKLNESIKENSSHLEEIAAARVKLQAEKEDLGKRLAELSEYYNKSINNMENENKNNIAKIIEIEKKFNEEIDKNRKLQIVIDAQCAQLVDTESHLKNTMKQLEETQCTLLDALNQQKKMENAQQELENSNNEIEKCNKQIKELNTTIHDMQKTIAASSSEVEQFKNDIIKKSKYIEELEMRQVQFEHNIKESECKMQFYEEQLLLLKGHIGKLQENIGEFDLINENTDKLNELSDQNEKLSEALQKQAEDLECYKNTIVEQEDFIKQKDDIISVLSEKEKEQANIIALLHKNLEVGSEVDTDIRKQMIEKDAEIKCLLAELNTKSKQISQLEKFIISLDDQKRKAYMQKKKYEKKIDILEKVIAENEPNIGNEIIETPTENLDSLIEILENEMETSVEPTNTQKLDRNNKRLTLDQQIWNLPHLSDSKRVCHINDQTYECCPTQKQKNKYYSQNLHSSETEMYDDLSDTLTGAKYEGPQFKNNKREGKLSKILLRHGSFDDSFEARKCKMFQFASHKFI